MSTALYLTDEDSDLIIPGTTTPYKRARLGARSDNFGLFRSATTLLAGDTLDQLTRLAGGKLLAWVTDPLSSAVGITAQAWTLHLWASSSASNSGVRTRVYKLTPAGAQTSLLDDVPVSAVTSNMFDVGHTTAVVTATTLADGDRLLIVLYAVNVGGAMGAGTLTFSYNGEFGYTEGDSQVDVFDAIAVLASTPSDVRTKVRNILIDYDATSPYFDDQVVDQAVTSALNEYTIDRPRYVTELYDADGSTYEFPLPRRWAKDISRITQIEYPMGNQQPTYLYPDDYVVRKSSVGSGSNESLHFVLLVPSAGSGIFGVTYTTRHELSTVLNTIPNNDYAPFLYLCASYVAMSGASKASQTSQGGINADAVNYQSYEQKWRDVAAGLRSVYEEHMGSGDVPGTGVTVQWKSTFSWGQERIFHRRPKF